MNALVIEVDVFPLEAERFPCPHSRQRQENEERAPGVLSESKDRLDLWTGKMCSNVSVSLWENELSHVNLPARIAPILCGREHRRESAENLEHGFP